MHEPLACHQEWKVALEAELDSHTFRVCLRMKQLAGAVACNLTRFVFAFFWEMNFFRKMFAEEATLGLAL